MSGACAASSATVKSPLRVRKVSFASAGAGGGRKVPGGSSTRAGAHGLARQLGEGLGRHPAHVGVRVIEPASQHRLCLLAPPAPRALRPPDRPDLPAPEAPAPPAHVPRAAASVAFILPAVTAAAPATTRSSRAEERPHRLQRLGRGPRAHCLQRGHAHPCVGVAAARPLLPSWPPALASAPPRAGPVRSRRASGTRPNHSAAPRRGLPSAGPSPRPAGSPATPRHRAATSETGVPSPSARRRSSSTGRPAGGSPS